MIQAAKPGMTELLGVVESGTAYPPTDLSSYKVTEVFLIAFLSFAFHPYTVSVVSFFISFFLSSLTRGNILYAYPFVSVHRKGRGESSGLLIVDRLNSEPSLYKASEALTQAHPFSYIRKAKEAVMSPTGHSLRLNRSTTKTPLRGLFFLRGVQANG